MKLHDSCHQTWDFSEKWNPAKIWIQRRCKEEREVSHAEINKINIQILIPILDLTMGVRMGIMRINWVKLARRRWTSSVNQVLHNLHWRPFWRPFGVIQSPDSWFYELIKSHPHIVHFFFTFEALTFVDDGKLLNYS